LATHHIGGAETGIEPELDADQPERLATSTGRPRNRILAALPDDVFRRVLPHLTTVPIRLKQGLYKAGEPVCDVYFPNGGVASITTTLLDGTTMEAVTVGDEGCVEPPRFGGRSLRMLCDQPCTF
jgi:hypothetical protein